MARGGRGGGWESPNSDAGTYAVVPYIFLYFVLSNTLYSRQREPKKCIRQVVLVLPILKGLGYEKIFLIFKQKWIQFLIRTSACF
jgi:hypothetical protein